MKNVNKNDKKIIIVVFAILFFVLFFLISSSVLAYSYYMKNLSSSVRASKKKIADSNVDLPREEPNTTSESELEKLQQEVFNLQKQIEEQNKVNRSNQTKSTSSSSVNVTNKTNGAKTTTKTEFKMCYNIREGKFKSNKCYSQKDYDDLVYYMGRYNSAVFSYNAAVSGIRITCNGSDFFKDACERDKEQKEDAERDMKKYEEKVKNLIKKGKSV